MPGKIVSVPFLAQIEDIDRCLKDSRHVKNPPVSNFSYSNSSKNMNNNGKNSSNANHGYGAPNHGYGYNNSYHYNKGSSMYYKKSGSNPNKNYMNGGNYDHYNNKNYDYMKYNTRKNNGNTNYFYNQRLQSQVPPNHYNKDSLYTSQLNSFNTDGANVAGNSDTMESSQVIAEQLKQTYPQIYQNTHSDVYQMGAPMNQMNNSKTNYDFSQLSNSLDNIQFSDVPSMNGYAGSQRNTVTGKYSNGQQQQQSLGYGNPQSLNMLMADTMQPGSDNVASINSYIPSELLDSGNAPFQSSQTMHNTMIPEMSPVPNSFIGQTDAMSTQRPLVGDEIRPGSAASSLPPTSMRSPMLQGTNHVFDEKSASMIALGNGSTTIPQKSNLMSMGWGSNNMNVQSSVANNNSSMNSTTGTNSNSSMFGIWNNDMSVWS